VRGLLPIDEEDWITGQKIGQLIRNEKLDGVLVGTPKDKRRKPYYTVDLQKVEGIMGNYGVDLREPSQDDRTIEEVICDDVERFHERLKRRK